jgi:hypothetical protein
MTSTRWIRRAALVAACMVAGACGLFETRTPEQPPPPTEGCRPLTSGTLAVVLNIEDFYGRLSGRTCYVSTLDTSFVFTPDPQDLSLFLPDTPFAGWDENVEGEVNQSIANEQKFIDVDFISEYASAIISTDQNTEQRFWDYQVRVAFQTPPDTLRFTGRADLTLHRQSNGEWKITSWVDHRAGAAVDSTWGRLRGSQRI